MRRGSRPRSTAVVVASLPIGATRIGLLPSSAARVFAPAATTSWTSFSLWLSITTALVVAAGCKTLAIDDGKSPILVAPIGKDATTTAIERELDPRRTVAVDLTGDANKRVTIMMPPNGDPQVRDAAAAMFARAGTRVTLIKDSPGFIAQRIVSMIANLGCEMAMIGIASAADVDTAMTLGLNYPRGPLALADWLGVKECHEILAQLQAITGDDRYRPSQWLRRRAMLGMSAMSPE